MLKIEKTVVDLKKTVGKNYKEFWDFKGRYRVVKGGRGSKKSTTAALWYIYHLLKHKNANLLCVRQFYNSLKDSQFSELKKACERLKVSHLFDFKISPLEITVKETGQKILFRGFDNPDSITSITVSHGYLCWVWIEEAYQVANEEEFNKLDFSIRGINDESLFPQITLTLNPWSEMWIKKRFFDKKDKNILAITRNYYHNEFLSEEDRKMFEDLKKNDYNSYKIVGEGEWGLSKGGYFNEFSYNLHTVPDMEIDFSKDYDFYASFDYGLDMFAAYFYRVDRFLNVYVYREIYKEDIIVSKAAQELAKYIKEENITNENVTYTQWFGWCIALETIAFDGTIGKSIDFQYSTKLTKASILNIFSVLSSTVAGQTLTLSKTAVTNAFGSTTATEWTNLVATKTNWTISLV